MMSQTTPLQSNLQILPPVPPSELGESSRLEWLPFQASFIGDMSTPTQYECWGVGTGKSVAGAAKSLMIALLYPGCTVGCIEPTVKMIDQVMKPALDAVIESFKAVNGFDPVIKRVAYTQTWHIFNGSKLRFFSAHKPERIIGSTLGAAWLDEESSYIASDYLLQVVRARLRGKGPRIIYATSTPNGRQGLLGECLDALDSDRSGVRVRQVPSWANPHLPPQFLAQMYSTYSGATWDQEVKAEISSASNLVYWQFSREKHVAHFDRKRLRTEPGWDLAIGLDWSGGAAAGAIVWAAIKGNGNGGLPQMVILDEWVGVASNSQLINLVVGSLNKYPMLPTMICPDPADFDGVADLRKALRPYMRGKSVVKWENVKYRRRVTYGVELASRLLGTPEGEVALTIDRPLLTGFTQGIIPALEHYRLKNGKIYDDNVYTHVLDAWRYVVLNLHRLGHQVRMLQSVNPGAEMRARLRDEEEEDQ